ncbi:MAG: MSHA pilin protein MshD [Kiritimatiellia bacterium]|jgi:MSHA pilin protein MshD
MFMKAAAYPNTLKVQGSKGFSLIELVISIMVLGIALGALSSSLFVGIGRSADPLLQTRATQLSQAYLDEILSMRYQEDSPLGGGSVGTCFIAGSEAGEISRSLYDDVDDYDGLTEQADFLDITTPSNYAGYTVNIGVTCDDVATNSKLIAVTITSPTNQNLVFSVIRADL